MSESPWPVVVVTGANAGVGFGICQRLLFQLCLSNPPDSQPQSWAKPSGDTRGSAEAPRRDGLTLIMACRSTERAEAARKELYQALDVHIAQLRSQRDYDGHADVFRRNLKIEIEYLDLSVLSSVFNFSVQMSKQYSYISHLIFNAGVANFTGIDWLAALKQIAANFVDGITRPRFNLQTVGEVSVDGLGWVWQSNLFGHYALFRALEPLLKSSAYPADARVIWSSSLESSPAFYKDADWQLMNTKHSYEAAKYQIDLIGTVLDRRALQDSSSTKRIRHFVSHPGVCSTKFSNNLVAFGGFLDTLKVIIFYLGRFFGSRHHPITPLKGGIAAVHLALVSLSYVTFYTFPLSKANGNGAANGTTNGAASGVGPVRFGAETDWWGNAEVGILPVEDWTENEAQAELLAGKCDQLFRDFSEKRRESAIDS